MKLINKDLKKNIIEDYYLKLELIKKIEKKKIEKTIDIIKKTLKRQNTIFICGNGGSASTSDHFQCDLLNRKISQTKNRKIVSLNNNISLITAIANDIGYENIFSHQIDKISRANDTLILFSVSGNSRNLIKAAQISKKKKLNIISFTGSDGGKLKNLSNLNINIESHDYGLVEDIHLSFVHKISDMVHGKKNVIK